MRVLFVEDNEIDQLAYERFIKQTNLSFQSVIVDSVSQAYNALQNETFDIILVDYLLGSETAFDLLTDTGDIPVVFITGFGDEDIAVRAMKAGAYDYIVKDAQSNYLKMIPVVFDNVINRKKLEMHAREIQEERIRKQILHQFIHDASHDLRTALTILSTSLQLCDRYISGINSKIRNLSLTEAQDDVEKLKTRYDRVKHDKDYLEHLILDMLEMVKLDTIEMLEFQRCDLNALVANVVAMFEPQAAEQDVQLTIKSTVKPLWIDADPHRITTIISNLLENALQFTPAQGSIFIQISEKDTYSVLEVSDTGSGIQFEELEKIFQRFYRTDKARGTETGSTGLGLPIIKRLVELHNGRIEVTSEPGKGSTFRVYLPQSRQER